MEPREPLVPRVLKEQLVLKVYRVAKELSVFKVQLVPKV
jgi:hypothetical protein